MTFGSLFSGLGGMDLGLTRAGMECIWQCEKDRWSRSILEQHWPDIIRYEDVRTLDGSRVRRPDLLCGGDPCQGNSKARGRRVADGDGPADHFIRLAGEIRPDLVLRENPSSTRRDAPWPWWRFRSELGRPGYAVLPFRLRACCLGADHQRDRLFLLAALPDAVCPGLEGEDTAIVEYRDPAGCDRRRPAPRICRRTDGISRRMDRLRGPGNAVHPDVAEYIGRLILHSVQ